MNDPECSPGAALTERRRQLLVEVNDTYPFNKFVDIPNRLVKWYGAIKTVLEMIFMIVLPLVLSIFEMSSKC